MWLLRPLVSLVLGIAIFVAFLIFLVANSLANRLLDASFYSRTFAQQDAYNRIYDEVMLDPQMREGARSLLGNLEVVGYEDSVQLLRMIMPPEYLQEQMESALARSSDYFKRYADTLELSIDLGPPLGRVKPVLFEYIDQRIGRLEVVDFGGRNCNPEQLLIIKAKFEEFFRALAAGEALPSVPSLEPVPQLCRAGLFVVMFTEANLAVLFSDFPGRGGVVQGLITNSGEIRQSFVDRGDTRGVLKAVARALAAPLMDDAIAQVRKGLDHQDRVDIISVIADWDGQITAAELRDAVGGFRDGVNGFPFFRQPALALAVVVAGSLLMGLVHLPRLAAAVRWPGLTLILTGGVCYAAAKVAQATLPNRLEDFLAGGASPLPAIPQAAIDLGGDILQSLSQQIFTGLAEPSLVVLVVGAVLFASSFAIAAIRPFLHGLR